MRVALLMLLVLITPASAFAKDDHRGRDWAIACTGCHGTEGRSAGAIPSIAGMERRRFVELMNAFKDGSQAATVMHQHAKGLSAEQIDTLAEYFSSRAAR